MAILPFLSLMILLDAQTLPAQLSDDEFFETKIRPIFSEHCSECHSSESNPISGGLHIGSRKSILAGGDTGPAIVSGKPEESLLVEAINYRGYYEMPPNSKLSQDKIDLIEEWVKRGAPWPENDDIEIAASSIFDLEARREAHWAWQPVLSQAPQNVNDKQWALDPIDRFILAKLEQNNLAPAIESERETWLRRVHFDLNGLPPSIEDVESFTKDSAIDAYEKVVDKLLASKQFGERWARHWMDLVRYAETYGHEYDFNIDHAFQYRDYLIRAFNEDVPYDQIVLEHIAGDLLPNPRLNPQHNYNESIIATGFWFLGEATHAPVDVKADEAGRIDNQIDVLCKTFQGLTVACARCHDHKFDAISATDYYALAGFLQSSRRQIALLDPNNDIENAYRDSKNVIAVANENVSKLLYEIKDVHYREWRDYLRELMDDDVDSQKDDADVVRFKAIAKLKQVQQRHHPLHVLTFLDKEVTLPKFQITELKNTWASNSRQFQSFMDETALFENFSGGIPEDWFASRWGFEDIKRDLHFSMCGNIVGQDSVVSSGRNGKKFQSVLRSPTFELKHDKIFVRVKGESSQIRLIIDGYEMDIHNALLFNGCNLDITNKDEFLWVTLGSDVKNYKGHRAYLEFIDHGDGFIQVDEIRFGNDDATGPVHRPGTLAKLVLDQDPKNRDEILKAISVALENFFQSSDDGVSGEYADITSLLAEHEFFGTHLTDARSAVEKTQEQTPSPMKVIAMADGTPEDEHLFIRGNSQTLGDIIPRRFLTALTEMVAQPTSKKNVGTGSGRLQLSNQITSKTNPLTSRVIVNRIWHHLMGHGIVRSVDNFGLMGQQPSHPELLDYLATELVNDSWSIKKMVRRLVLTKTYRMSSFVDSSADEVDPENNLLHRANIKRLEGETIRDSILKVSSSLNETFYGPSVSIYLTDFMQGRGRPRKSGPQDGECRRSIYIAVRRNFLSPMMLAFDSPIPFNTIGARHQSNVPAQALIMMNDPFIVEQAGKWSQVIVQSKFGTRKRIERIFVAAFGRLPSNAEMKDSLNFLGQQANESDVENGSIRDNERVWQDYCHVVFNMKEFIFVK